MMPCYYDKILVDAYADGELSPEETKKVEEHLTTCEECRQRVGAVKALSHVVGGVLRKSAPSGPIRGLVLGEKLETTAQTRKTVSERIDAKSIWFKKRPSRFGSRWYEKVVVLAASFVLVYVILDNFVPSMRGSASDYGEYEDTGTDGAPVVHVRTVFENLKGTGDFDRSIVDDAKDAVGSLFESKKSRPAPTAAPLKPPSAAPAEKPAPEVEANAIGKGDAGLPTVVAKPSEARVKTKAPQDDIDGIRDIPIGGTGSAGSLGVGPKGFGIGKTKTRASDEKADRGAVTTPTQTTASEPVRVGGGTVYGKRAGGGVAKSKEQSVVANEPVVVGGENAKRERPRGEEQQKEAVDMTARQQGQLAYAPKPKPAPATPPPAQPTTGYRGKAGPVAEKPEPAKQAEAGQQVSTLHAAAGYEVTIAPPSGKKAGPPATPAPTRPAKETKAGEKREPVRDSSDLPYTERGYTIQDVTIMAKRLDKNQKASSADNEKAGGVVPAPPKPPAKQSKLRTGATEREKALEQQVEDMHELVADQQQAVEVAGKKALVDARFLEVRGAFLEEIGVQWSDIPATDPNIAASPRMQNAMKLMGLLPEETGGVVKETGKEEPQQFVVLTAEEVAVQEQEAARALEPVQPEQVEATKEEPAAIETTQGAVFKEVPVNPFVLTENDKFSTFAIDVDTASYALCGRYIRGGYLPPRGAVRMEEFVNAFDYNYPRQPQNVFNIYTEAMPSPFGEGLVLLKVGVMGKVVGREARKPANIVFVIDASGSMDRPDRLPLVQYAVEQLVNVLEPEDRVSLVTYGTHANLVLENVSASDRDTILKSVNAIQTSGSTNMLEGIRLGYEIAQRTYREMTESASQQGFVMKGVMSRVMLLSDGVANIGTTDTAQILKDVEQYKNFGITFSSAGFGMGSYNDTTLEQLSNKGDGSYVFIGSKREAKRVFGEEMSANLQTIAKDAKIQVEFNPTTVRRYRLVGYENRDIADKDFRNDAIDAGEVGSGQCATALYELELFEPQAGMKPGDVGTVYVRYRNTDTMQVEEIASKMAGDMVRRYEVRENPRLYLAAAVAEFAELLRESEHAKSGNLAAVESMLRKVAAALTVKEQGRLVTDPKVSELIYLVRRAQGLPRAQ